MTSGQATTLNDVIDQIDGAAREQERVSVDAVLDAVGHGSFGPLLVLAGLVIAAPVVGDIPGVPTLMGVLVFVTSAQLLIGRDHFWLPGFILRRSVSQQKVQKALSWIRRPARFLDRHSRPRMEWLTGRSGTRLIAALSMGIAVLTVPMEVVPFSANLAGLALVSFGLSLIARDGLIGTFALIVTTATFAVVFYNLLS